MFRSSVVSIGLRSYLTDNTVLSIIKYSDLNAGFNAKCLLLYTSQLYQMRYFTPRSCTKCDTPVGVALPCAKPQGREI